LVAFYPVEIILQRLGFSKNNLAYLIVLFNMLIGQAIVLGKIQRVNSWDVFMNPNFVISSALTQVNSYQLVVLGILFGLFTNFFYFLLRDKAKKLYSSWVSEKPFKV